MHAPAAGPHPPVQPIGQVFCVFAEPSLVDDAVTAPPTLEEVRPMSPFRNVARATKSARPARAEQHEPRVSATGWAIASAVLIVCSLLAITFYRR